MTLKLVKKLFDRVQRSLQPFKSLPSTGGRPITGGRPAMPVPPGSTLGDWLTQTVTYHH